MVDQIDKNHQVFVRTFKDFHLAKFAFSFTIRPGRFEAFRRKVFSRILSLQRNRQASIKEKVWTPEILVEHSCTCCWRDVNDSLIDCLGKWVWRISTLAGRHYWRWHVNSTAKSVYLDLNLISLSTISGLKASDTYNYQFLSASGEFWVLENQP